MLRNPQNCPSGASHSNPRIGHAVRGLAVTGTTLVLLAGATSADAAQEFSSRPDLRPPSIKVTTKAHDTAPGLIFVSPRGGKDQTGPMIFDEAGDLVFFKPLAKGVSAFDMRAQTYRGKPVITWFEGKLLRGYGHGVGVIYDQGYNQIARVKAARGQQVDIHEFNITPDDTALILGYRPKRQDTRGVKGGKRNDLAMQNVVQEIDIATGKLLFEWDANKHVAPSETYTPRPSRSTIPFDYIHANSVNRDTDGNLLVSARATHTIYKVNRKTGKIMWRLGGRKSTFKMGRGTRTAWQHDAHRRADGTISSFDNNADAPAKGKHSRGVSVRINEKAKTATLVRQWVHPKKLLSPSQANTQFLPNGNVMIGWGGGNSNMSEFSKGGKLLFDATMSGNAQSYRAYRLPWSGQPTSPPRAAATVIGATTTVRASWNGATTVAAWRAVGGPAPDQLVVRGTVGRDGFETPLSYAAADAYVAVEALDAAGNPLGRSATVKVGTN